MKERNNKKKIVSVDAHESTYFGPYFTNSIILTFVGDILSKVTLFNKLEYI